MSRRACVVTISTAEMYCSDTDSCCGARLVRTPRGDRIKQRYWVEMRWTIMWMMREPRGQAQRSMLGLLILSSSSWSSSHRSIFTSSATWRGTKARGLQRAVLLAPSLTFVDSDSKHVYPGRVRKLLTGTVEVSNECAAVVLQTCKKGRD